MFKLVCNTFLSLISLKCALHVIFGSGSMKTSKGFFHFLGTLCEGPVTRVLSVMFMLQTFAQQLCIVNDLQCKLFLVLY